MKKKKTVILIILAVIIAGLGALIYWQWNNIEALRYFATYSEEERQNKLDENEKAISDILDGMSGIDISRLSDEAVKMLQNGELTEEEAIAIITNKTTLDEIKSGKATLSNNSSNLETLIAKIYVLRSTYVGKLDSLVSQAYGEYKAGGDSDAIVDKYIGIASGMEGECDGQIESLLSQIKTELEKTGGDMSLINQIRTTYKNEKSIKKGDLLSKYSNYKNKQK